MRPGMWLQLRELQFPEAQHVLLDAKLRRHLADIAKCFNRLCQGTPPLNAELGLLSRVAPHQAGVDALLHDVARPEDQHLARRNRHLLAGLGIAADALTLLADAE